VHYRRAKTEYLCFKHNLSLEPYNVCSRFRFHLLLCLIFRELIFYFALLTLKCENVFMLLFDQDINSILNSTLGSTLGSSASFLNLSALDIYDVLFV